MAGVTDVYARAAEFWWPADPSPLQAIVGTVMAIALLGAFILLVIVLVAVLRDVMRHGW